MQRSKRGLAALHSVQRFRGRRRERPRGCRSSALSRGRRRPDIAAGRGSIHVFSPGHTRTFRYVGYVDDAID
jgi:hypothetical protein